MLFTMAGELVAVVLAVLLLLSPSLDEPSPEEGLGRDRRNNLALLPLCMYIENIKKHNETRLVCYFFPHTSEAFSCQ